MAPNYVVYIHCAYSPENMEYKHNYIDFHYTHNVANQRRGIPRPLNLPGRPIIHDHIQFYAMLL